MYIWSKTQNAKALDEVQNHSLQTVWSSNSHLTPARWSLCHSTVYPLFEISSMHVFIYSTETLLEFYFQILCKFWLAFQACQVHNLCSGEGKICDVITSILFFQNDFSLRYNFQHNHKRFWSASLLQVFCLITEGLSSRSPSNHRRNTSDHILGWFDTQWYGRGKARKFNQWSLWVWSTGADQNVTNLLSNIGWDFVILHSDELILIISGIFCLIIKREDHRCKTVPRWSHYKEVPGKWPLNHNCECSVAWRDPS